MDFEEDTPPSLKFDSDGKRVVFAFSCFLDTTESTAGIPEPLRVIEVATGFDALNEAELTLEGMQLMSTDMRSSRVRMATLRAINSRLSRMRRRLGPQRGIFERISEEIGRIEGLQADSRDYFGRIYGPAQSPDRRHRRRGRRAGEADRPAIERDDLLADRTPLAFILLGIGAPLVGAALTLYIVRRRGTPIEPDRGA